MQAIDKKEKPDRDGDWHFQRSLFTPPAAPEIHGNDYAFLRTNPVPKPSAKKIRVVDLFSGCGGISLGLREAASDRNLGFEVVVAADFEKTALGVYVENFKPECTIGSPIDSVLSHEYESRLTLDERRLARQAGRIDILVGGPPCQGHSDLNNSTRRDDPKNGLYFAMARAARVFTPRAVVIENVPGAFHDKNSVVQRTLEALSKLGYELEVVLVDGLTVGLPQRRKRLFVVGVQGKGTQLKKRIESCVTSTRDVSWAIADLVETVPNSMFDQAALPTDETRRRIDYLFDNDLYDLPDEMRPACHRDKKHSYKSVYGRLRWDQPAQTITSGFYSMCMGRYVHPVLRRTLTAHEAARLQFFPDSFSFASVMNRTALATIIGNAVPPKLAYVVGTEIIDAGGVGEVQTSADVVAR